MRAIVVVLVIMVFVYDTPRKMVFTATRITVFVMSVGLSSLFTLFACGAYSCDRMMMVPAAPQPGMGEHRRKSQNCYRVMHHGTFQRRIDSLMLILPLRFYRVNRCSVVNQFKETICRSSVVANRLPLASFEG